MNRYQPENNKAFYLLTETQMPTETTPADFVKSIVQNLVSKPDEVAVEQTEDDKGTLLTLKVAKGDIGTVIGKGGATAKSLRTIVRVFAANTEAKAAIGLKIAE